jgi:2-C-methyl-D-erythritol 4-phosphate cytidylyltransferase/2-C-methyl-D-erythritol 2,4-cyclodiphosphate synthase
MDNAQAMGDDLSHPHIAAVIVAAGRGSRSGQDVPKQYARLGGEPVLRRTVQAFVDSPVETVLVVIHPDDEALYRDAVAGIEGLLPAVKGGRTRQFSVLKGLEALGAAPPQTVLIHDAARPFVSGELIAVAAAGVEAGRGTVPSLPVTDTLRRSEGVLLGPVVPREGVQAMQTPQAFPFGEILEAHRAAIQLGHDDLSDDAAVFQLSGKTVKAIAGDRRNIKLTRPEDFAYAERMIAAETDFRTGQGYDVHAFDDGDGVTLCGVRIPFDRSLKGHSDADVGLHALTDAVFGAMADGDIGSHFPPSDPQWKGMASEHFLKHALSRLTARGGRVVSLDVTLICEAPKIGPHRDAMRNRIAEICAVSVTRISVKATTSERLGFTGRGEGIAATAVATISLPVDR